MFYYFLWFCLIVANIQIANMKQRIGFKWFIISALGPLATVWFVFFMKPPSPADRNDRVYQFYKNTFFRRERCISDWSYQNRILDDLRRESFNRDEIIKLSAHVNANLEAKRADIGWTAVISSATIAFVIGVIGPFLSTGIPKPDEIRDFLDKSVALLIQFIAVFGCMVIALRAQKKHVKNAIIAEALNIIKRELEEAP